MSAQQKPSNPSGFRRHGKRIIPLLPTFHDIHSFAAVDIDDMRRIARQRLWFQNGLPRALWKRNPPLKIRLANSTAQIPQKEIEDSTPEAHWLAYREATRALQDSLGKQAPSR